MNLKDSQATEDDIVKVTEAMLGFCFLIFN